MYTSDLTAPTTLLNDITEQLVGSHHEDDDAGNPSPQRAFVTHLYPAECTNITLTMKALINGFIKKPPNEHDGKASVQSAIFFGCRLKNMTDSENDQKDDNFGREL
jgi:hypothetical protein